MRFKYLDKPNTVLNIVVLYLIKICFAQFYFEVNKGNKTNSFKYFNLTAIDQFTHHA